MVNGKYRVEALVGRGGMGRTDRARHLTLDRVVVLKMLHRAYSGDPQIVQRFQREARAASRLDHPNSIAVLDFGEAEDGTLFMVMEYLDGKDLGRVLQEEFPLPRGSGLWGWHPGALVFSRGPCEGNHRPPAPQAGERDGVSPRRDNPDFVKVLDFGIAKIVSAAPWRAQAHPGGPGVRDAGVHEPGASARHRFDARSDLYSMASCSTSSPPARSPSSRIPRWAS